MSRREAPAVGEQSPPARDWDARSYERVSGPQAAWAEKVLDRLALRGHETVLDAGCGSGRVTKMLLERLPEGRVVAVDSAPSMVAEARQALDPVRATVIEADLAQLRLEEPVDATFSNAVFHWVPDHDALFARLFEALGPGGRLEAQCGGEGNVERFHEAAREVGEREPFYSHLSGWTGPWNFAGPAETAERLRGAGFEQVKTSLEPWPVTLEEPVEYLRTVCLGHHLERLPGELHGLYAEAVAAECGTPLTLDYVRLNLSARRPRV
ncbi:MAG: methyltransferase domain-containing protein [Actinomycetota bacterium]|nr:methyltransferase domain-containing protein [Actinomycetota bacterium]